MSFNTYPNNPFPPSTEQMHRGDNEELQAQIDAIKDGATIDSFGDVETALATKTDNAVIAPEFDAEAGIYSVGDLVMYEGKLYEFTTAHETAGDWNSEEVTEKTIADEVDTLKSGLIDKVQGIINDQLTACKVISFVHYTDDNAYNVWTGHNFTITELTKIVSVHLCVVNSDPTQFCHEVELTGISNNSFAYAVKGGWSGGLSGVNVICTVIGI